MAQLLKRETTPVIEQQPLTLDAEEIRTQPLELVPTEDHPAPAVRRDNVVALPSDGPMTQALAFLQGGGNVELLERMMNLQERYESGQKERAHNEAFAAFKAEAVVILKSSKVVQGPLEGKKYANLADVVLAVTPALSKHGLAVSWKLTRDEPQWLEVTCTLRHVSGHRESVSMGGEPDAGPGRNKIQARASTKSYLERYTVLSILGMAASEQDDDGNGGPLDPNARPFDPDPPAPPPPPQREYYPEADFNANSNTWRELVLSGRKTSAQIIATVEARAPLTNDQKKVINDWSKKQ